LVNELHFVHVAEGILNLQLTGRDSQIIKGLSVIISEIHTWKIRSNAIIATRLLKSQGNMILIGSVLPSYPILFVRQNALISIKVGQAMFPNPVGGAKSLLSETKKNSKNLAAGFFSVTNLVPLLIIIQKSVNQEDQNAKPCFGHSS